MASPPDPDAEATRGETSEEGNEASEDGESSLNEEVVEVPDDDESPPNETIVKVSTGQDLTVVLEDKEVKLKIQHDALGRIRVFGLETGDLMPMMSQRPGSFDVVLSERRFGNKFDFFGLPREIRDNIYCIIFGLETFPSVFTDLEGNLEHTENFRYKRPIHPIRFLARLNKTAPSAGCGIAFINQQSLQETTLVLLRSKRFHVSGDKQAISLLESMSSYGRSMWIHPLVLNLNNWETNAERAGQWMRIIYRSMHHRFRGLVIKIGDNGWKIDKYADIMSTPLARLLTARDKLGYRRVEFVPKLGGKEEKNFLWAFFCTIGCLHGELEEANLVKKVYEALERAAKNKQA